MQQVVAGAIFLGIGVVLGVSFSNNLSGAAFAQYAPPAQSGDALWHLPRFGDEGWFLHASNGKVRACNMDKASVVNDKAGPRCSGWE